LLHTAKIAGKKSLGGAVCSEWVTKDWCSALDLVGAFLGCDFFNCGKTHLLLSMLRSSDVNLAANHLHICISCLESSPQIVDALLINFMQPFFHTALVI